MLRQNRMPETQLGLYEICGISLENIIWSLFPSVQDIKLKINYPHYFGLNALPPHWSLIHLL